MAIAALNTIFVRKISFLIEKVNRSRNGFGRLSYFTRKRLSTLPWSLIFLL